jgi:hypothetical protein
LVSELLIRRVLRQFHSLHRASYKWHPPHSRLRYSFKTSRGLETETE